MHNKKIFKFNLLAIKIVSFIYLSSIFGVNAGIASHQPSAGGPRPSLARKKHVPKPHFGPNPSIETKAQLQVRNKKDGR